jgi:hypothetical protein
MVELLVLVIDPHGCLPPGSTLKLIHTKYLLVPNTRGRQDSPVYSSLGT